MSSRFVSLLSCVLLLSLLCESRARKTVFEGTSTNMSNAKDSVLDANRTLESLELKENCTEMLTANKTKANNTESEPKRTKNSTTTDTNQSQSTDNTASLHKVGPNSPKGIVVGPLCNKDKWFDKTVKKCRNTFKGLLLFRYKCSDPVIYTKDEYAISPKEKSAVINRKTGEILHSAEYRIVESSTNGRRFITVCRAPMGLLCPHHNWIGAIDEDHFTVLGKKSIVVKSQPVRVYKSYEYRWQRRRIVVCERAGTSIAICSGRLTFFRLKDEKLKIMKNSSNEDSINQLPSKCTFMQSNNSDVKVSSSDFQEIISNCSGTFVQMDDDEFVVLENGTVFVNISRRLYDISQYTWFNGSLFVCENIPKVLFSKFSESRDEVLVSLTFYCMLISITSLIFVLVTYSLFSELRTPPGLNLMNLSVSILLGQTLWAFGSRQIGRPITCKATAMFLHYFFLVSFVWTAIIAFSTWKAFTSNHCRLADAKRRHRTQFLRHMAVGWLPVLLFVSICVALDTSHVTHGIIGYGSRGVCWIGDPRAKLYFFILPAALMIVFNIAMFCMTVKAIKDTQRQVNVMIDQSERRRRFAVYVRIASLMGFTWVFGFAASFGYPVLSYMFVILQSLQGLYIAIAFAFTARTRKLYSDLIRGKRSGKKCGNGSGSGSGRSSQATASNQISKSCKTVVTVTEVHVSDKGCEV